jgi:predicted RND superfamily exporter protein
MSSTSTRPILQSLAIWARHHYRPIFLATAALFLVSLWLAAQLRFETDVLNLLPQKEPAVENFRQTLEEFGSADVLLVVVRVPPDVALAPYEVFVDRLGERLEESALFSQVDYKIGGMNELLESFLPSALLFLDEEGRRELTARLDDPALRDRVRELRRLVSTPQAIALKKLMMLDPLGVSEVFLGRLTSTRAGLSLDWASGYFLSRDRQMLLILAKPTEAAQNVDFAKMLVGVVDRGIDAVRGEWPEFTGPAAGGPPEVVLGGRYVVALGDDTIIRRDAITNILTSMIGVLTLFLFAFRRFGLLIYAFVPLCFGLAMTFGLSALLYGGLSAATSGVAALLIGLGIDFVIVSYGRYVEERQAGVGLSEALARMSGSSGRAVVVGGVTSAATFFSFGVTDFTGLYQMGYLTGVGILCCMAAVLVLLPAMLAWSEDHHEQRRDRGPTLFLHGLGSARLIRASLRRPWIVLALALLITLVAGRLAVEIRFNDSVQAMRPSGNPGVTIRDEVAERFGRGFDQMMLVITGSSEREVLELSGRAAAGARQLVQDGVLTGYDSVNSMIPPPEQQREALAWLEEKRDSELAVARIRKTFAEVAAEEGLRVEPFEAGLDLFAQAVSRSRPIGTEDFADFPPAQKLLRRYLLADENGWKSVVYLYPPAKVWRREPPPAAERLADELGPQAVLTGANVMSRILRERVLHDAVVAAILGFVLVAVLLWLDYRRIGDTVLSLAPLLVGIVWMLGGMVALGESMNFMNIFVTTMIIGIGVDYGVHMIHRFREFSSASDEELYGGLVETGKAIVLAALSTTIGFGSLSFSHYPGLRSMGKVAILGAIASALVAVTVLPAYLALIRKRSARTSASRQPREPA